jgi:transposase InsO family protein
MNNLRLPETLAPLKQVPDRTFHQFANRAILKAARLMGVAGATHLGSFRGRDGGFEDLASRLQEAQIKHNIAWEISGLLQERFGKVPERNRPHYNASQRFHILELRKTLGWNLIQTAKNFLVCENTISSWEESQNPETKTVGLATLKTPIRRFDDGVRHLVQRMVGLGFGGNVLVAKHLLAAGWKICEKTVRNIKREKRAIPNTVPTTDKARPIPVNPVQAHFVNHVWMMDITEVKNFFATQKFYLAVVFDAYSRMPLACMAFDKTPSGAQIARLFKTVVKNFGIPTHLISDLGGQFISDVFLKTVARSGAQHRFASVENLYANARLERFWKTLKGIGLLRVIPPLTFKDFETRTAIALYYYIHFRPHTSLGSTPAQAFYGAKPMAATAPPRGLEGQVVLPSPIDVEFVGISTELPFLRRNN